MSINQLHKDVKLSATLRSLPPVSRGVEAVEKHVDNFFTEKYRAESVLKQKTQWSTGFKFT